MTTARELALVAVAVGLTAATTAGAAPPDAPVAYVVKPGDTLIGFARSYLTKPSDYLQVQKANRIATPRYLKVGSRLLIDPNLLKSTPIDARLSAVSGPVELETAGQRAPARAGMVLVEGQRLHTGDGAFATFEMADDSRVTLPSNTSLRIDRMRQTILNNAPQRVFQMDKGRGTISATPNSNPNAKFEVRTPVSISAVRGTEFRVGQDPSGSKAQTEVLKGAVGVELASATTSGPPVPAGFGVSATPTGVGQPVKLLPPPKLGDGGQRQGDKIVHFTIQPVDKAAAYRLALSRDAGFVDIFAESTTQTTTQTPTAEFGAVPNGTYFLRLTAIDGGGLEGLPGDYSFDRDLDILEPGAPPAAQASGKHRNFLFRWSAAGDGVRVFRFQLFAGEDATSPIIDQPGLSEPQLTLTDLQPGTYSWRVSAVRFKGGAYSEKVGPLQTLQIGR
jgi:hypothetical protein